MVTPGLPESVEDSFLPTEYAVPWETHLITSKRHADALLERVAKSGICAIDTETTGLTWTLGDKAFMGIFAPDLETSWACWNGFLVSYIMDKMVEMGTNLVFHNFKFDAEMLFSADWWTPSSYDDMKVDDTMIGFRLLFAGQGADLKTASVKYTEEGVDVDGPQKAVHAWFEEDFKRRKAEKKRVKGKYVVKLEKHFDQVPFDLMFPYATQDAALTLRSYYGLQKERELRERLSKLWRREVDLLQILVSAEKYGWHLERNRLDERITEAQTHLSHHLREFEDIAPGVDVFSSKQLQNYVYETLGEPVKHLTKKGNPSVDETALSDLTDNPEIGAILVKIRQWKKLLDKCNELRTYLMDDDSVHSDLKLMGARTGRFSSAGPALQNIFNFREEYPWTWVRDLFVPRAGTEWLFFDYSQIEMRLAAHYSKDPRMTEAIIGKQDLHQVTAAQMFGIPLEEVTKLQRSLAKIINFSILYGAGARNVTDTMRFGGAGSDPVNINEARRALLKFIPYADDGMLVDPYPALAKQILKAYWNAFPAMKGFIDQVQGVARSRGYIITLFGRETPVPPEWARKATNYLIQGSAADLMKEAMVRTWKAAKEYCAEHGLTPWKDVFLFMTIHDEIIFALPPGHTEAFAKKIGPAATTWGLRVPIEVEFSDVKADNCWAKKKKMFKFETEIAA